MADGNEPRHSDVYMPVKALNLFSVGWLIKARVVKKGKVRHWSNSNGEGCLLNIELLDKDGTLIQATGFREIAEQLSEIVEENQVYTFCGG